jgi:hypothetical protein
MVLLCPCFMPGTTALLIPRLVTQARITKIGPDQKSTEAARASVAAFYGKETECPGPMNASNF